MHSISKTSLDKERPPSFPLHLKLLALNEKRVVETFITPLKMKREWKENFAI